MTRSYRWTILATAMGALTCLGAISGCEGLLDTNDLSEREGGDGRLDGNVESGAAADGAPADASDPLQDADAGQESGTDASPECVQCPDAGCPVGCPVRTIAHPTFATGSFGALGGDAYHIDQSGQLWHKGFGEVTWSRVPSKVPLAGGLARLTSTVAANYDAIVATGADGRLYEYFTQANSPYTWHEIGVPPGCDSVVGAPSVGSGDPANPNLGISCRCSNDRVGSATKSDLGSWTWADVELPAGVASDPAEGFETDVYVVGSDGRVYRCAPRGPGASCALAAGKQYPAGYTFVGAPGVAYLQSAGTPTPSTKWLLIADSLGDVWQFDVDQGDWTLLGHPSCGEAAEGDAEGDVSAAVDSVHGAWIAAVRCTNHEAIAVYSMTPGSPWRQVDTITYAGLPLSKPLVSAQGHLTVTDFETNVSFQTSAGEQAHVWYVGAARTRNGVESLGVVAP